MGLLMILIPTGIVLYLYKPKNSPFVYFSVFVENAVFLTTNLLLFCNLTLHLLGDTSLVMILANHLSFSLIAKLFTFVKSVSLIFSFNFNYSSFLEKCIGLNITQL